MSAFVSSDTGFIKEVDWISTKFTNINILNKISKIAVELLCWESCENKTFFCARSDRSITLCNPSNYDNLTWNLDSVGSFNGLEYAGENTLFSCTEDGVKSWRLDPLQPTLTATHTLDVGPNICRMRRDAGSSLVATGGKENDLKVWDFESSKAVFCAKNVRNDWLRLRVGVWIKDLAFLDANTLVTGTAFKQVRVYDIRCGQRRPVVETTFHEYPLSALGQVAERQVVVGNTQGEMGLIDVRRGWKAPLVHKYKGVAGSLRSIVRHPSEPVVLSCSVDRYAFAHHIDNKQHLHKVYCKSRLTSILSTADSILNPPKVEPEEKPNAADLDFDDDIKDIDIKDIDDVKDTDVKIIDEIKVIDDVKDFPGKPVDETEPSWEDLLFAPKPLRSTEPTAPTKRRKPSKQNKKNKRTKTS